MTSAAPNHSRWYPTPMPLWKTYAGAASAVLLSAMMGAWLYSALVPPVLVIIPPQTQIKIVERDHVYVKTCLNLTCTETEVIDMGTR